MEENLERSLAGWEALNGSKGFRGHSRKTEGKQTTALDSEEPRAKRELRGRKTEIKARR
jgi:hypothetical protein